MLGSKSVHAEECFAGEFIGTDFGIHEDLTPYLSDEWRDFNNRYVPIYLSSHPDKNKDAHRSGPCRDFFLTVSKGIKTGDFVLSPDGTGRYRIGEVTGGYYYAPNQVLFHRRPVRWTDTYIAREGMSESLRSSARSSGTVSDLSNSGHTLELDRLVGATRAAIIVADKTVEDPTVFAWRNTSRSFWSTTGNTPIGQELRDLEDEDSDGEQVKADDGYIDILASVRTRKSS